jgi:hypothetical protein
MGKDDVDVNVANKGRLRYFWTGLQITAPRYVVLIGFMATTVHYNAIHYWLDQSAQFPCPITGIHNRRSLIDCWIDS